MGTLVKDVHAYCIALNTIMRICFTGSATNNNNNIIIIKKGDGGGRGLTAEIEEMGFPGVRLSGRGARETPSAGATDAPETRSNDGRSPSGRRSRRRGAGRGGVQWNDRAAERRGNSPRLIACDGNCFSAASGLAKMAPRRRQDERAGFKAGEDAPRRDGDDARESRHPGACGQD